MELFTLRNVPSQLRKLSSVALREGRRVSGWEREDVLQLQQHLLWRVLRVIRTVFFQSQRLHLVCEFSGFLSQLPGDSTTSFALFNSVCTVCDNLSHLMTKMVSNKH